MEHVVIRKRAPVPAKLVLRQLLLLCGILSSLTYIAINIFVPLEYPGYNMASQTVSELSAIDAPTRSLWVSLCSVYSALVIAFSFGVWLAAGSNRRLKAVAVLLLVYGVSGFFWPPMHQRSVLAAGGHSMTDTMHLVFGGVTVILMLVMIGLSAISFGRLFLRYSIGTLIVMVLFGTLTSLDAPRVAANLPTPAAGIWERINIGAFMIWLIVLALLLLDTRRKQSTTRYGR